MNEIDKTLKSSNLKKELKKEKKRILIKQILSNKQIITGSLIMTFLILFTILAPFFSSFTPYEMEVMDRLKAPSSTHLLGTDNYGRDLFSRVANGAKVSMSVGLAVTFFSSIMGVIFGLYASYYRWLDNLIMRINDGLMVIPGILLAIALMTALGPRTENVIIALSVVFTPHIARIVRSTALVVREQTYIESMHAQGARSWRIMWLHIAPNTLSALVVQATFIFADSIISEASLSFLGAGVPTPAPSWGNILSDGKGFITNAPWMTVFPAIFIILAVLGLNLFGDGLRDLIDPNVKK